VSWVGLGKRCGSIASGKRVRRRREKNRRAGNTYQSRKWRGELWYRRGERPRRERSMHRKTVLIGYGSKSVCLNVSLQMAGTTG
jgi:hypothetical protein